MKNSFSHDISLEPLCKEHLDGLARSLREQDRAEMWAAYRLPAREGLELCWRLSSRAVALLYRGRPVAAAGVQGQTCLGSRACVWSWTGEEVAHCPKEFWWASRAVVAQFRGLYPFLYAACDERYTQARRYLERLGARRIAAPFYLAGEETRFLAYVFAAPPGRIFTNKEKKYGRSHRRRII